MARTASLDIPNHMASFWAKTWEGICCCLGDWLDISWGVVSTCTVHHLFLYILLSLLLLLLLLFPPFLSYQAVFTSTHKFYLFPVHFPIPLGGSGGMAVWCFAAC